MVEPVILSAIETIEAAYEAHGVFGDGSPVPRAPTGFPCIDATIGGLSYGELTVFGALPGVGKSTALLYMARSMEKAGFTPGVVSVEDSPITVGERIQSFYSGIAAIDVRMRGHEMRKSPQAKKAIEISRSSKTLYAFPMQKTLSDVLQTMDTLVKQGANVLIVDYLTAIQSTGDDMRASYSRVVNEIKTFSILRRVPVVLAAQMRRPSGKFYDEPHMSELGETSFLERAAEIILLFWKTKEGATVGKLEKLKYSRQNTSKFLVTLDINTGNLITSEYTEPVENEE